ncbi:hypothetical protein PFICI_08546 [Pestalotiopsis fici W106-1]|uniref:Zn(2)-C6 fungal-type domain-containing protein n=1 Tax=Pestalotiopsis fici (strain W106-1 / CGMCC3.15140) TaxID=1229662 RepID=W3WXV7_PESFW|nr:uncharacterized protein PFICI_08546 [Pestalotiopsis fici W106-1]ETS78693.1 hypothetical protein PFICI_08546 [Pestalotiopsis fici W106-1]
MDLDHHVDDLADGGLSGASPRPQLPPSTNRRFRRKKQRDRVRVTRACDRCKRRKVKCDGYQPCNQCSLPGLGCTYEATYSRGHRGSDPKLRNRSDPSSLPLHSPTRVQKEQSLASPARRPMKAGPPGDNDHSDDPNDDLPYEVSESAESLSVDMVDESIPIDMSSQPAPVSSKTSPEPSQTDLQGHYVGPASGVSFLLRVQKKLHQTISFPSNCSIFTFGDAPLPQHDPSFCLLIPRDEAEKLLECYFGVAVPTHRFLHRPTVASWLEEFYQTRGTMRNQDDAAGRRAVLLMVFAQAQTHMPHPDTPPDLRLMKQNSARCFLAADHQLSEETGRVRLTSVQARLAQCFWLLSQSRINHCWTLFGTMSHLAYAIGLNRDRKVDSALGMNLVEVECRRRTFWCAYSLDNYLSAALGRPRTFHDHDIDQELPSPYDDEEIFPDRIVQSHSRGQSIMLCPVAHVKLSQIVSTILWDLYSIHPATKTQRAALITKSSKALKEWRAGLAHFLDDQNVNAALLIPIYQRQRNVLNLAYWHAVILTHRPVLLRNFPHLQEPRNANRSHSSIRECLAAAMSIVKTVDALVGAGQMLKAYWFTIYFAFSAVVILYVYVFQQKLSPAASYEEYLEAAIRCHDNIARVAENNTLTQRYSLVLDQLRIEVLSRIRGQSGSNAASASMPEAPLTALSQALSQSSTALGESEPTTIPDALSAFSSNGFAEDLADSNASSASPLGNEIDWNQFDSMV